MGRPKSKSKTQLTNLKSETRQLTELVGVRLSPADMAALQHEATSIGISVAQFLRESGLRCARGVAVADLSRAG
jgi:hypothetical protein